MTPPRKDARGSQTRRRLASTAPWRSVLKLGGRRGPSCPDHARESGLRRRIEPTHWRSLRNKKPPGYPSCYRSVMDVWPRHPSPSIGERLRSWQPTWRLEPTTGLDVQLCGDAHLVNFGGFGAPDRDLLFDVNDFDETNPGPFEWDIKRFVASLEIAGSGSKLESSRTPRGRLPRAPGHIERRSASSLESGASRSGTRDSTWRALSVDGGPRPVVKHVRNLQRTAAKAETKNNIKAFDKLTWVEDGEIRFLSDPPLLVPVSEVFSGVEAARVEDAIAGSLRRYRHSCPKTGDTCSTATVLSTWPARWSGWAASVPGAGSRSSSDRTRWIPCSSRSKRPRPRSSRSDHGKSQFANHGQRVVEGQRSDASGQRHHAGMGPYRRARRRRP